MDIENILANMKRRYPTRWPEAVLDLILYPEGLLPPIELKEYQVIRQWCREMIAAGVKATERTP